MTPAELVLIRQWARGHWTNIAWACRSGDLRTGVDGLIGGSLHDDDSTALGGATQWSADAAGLAAYRFSYRTDETDPAAGRSTTAAVRWSRVRAWLWQDGGWTVADRKAMHQAYVDFYAVYPPRADEDWKPDATREEARERTARYNARMAGADGEQMRAAQQRARDLIDAHTMAEPALF